MDLKTSNDAVAQRAAAMAERIDKMKATDQYYYNQPITELRGGSKVVVDGREMAMFASYSYLGLVGHERIDRAAQEAVEKYGTGTHGVRTLAGSLDLHDALEETIADFKNTEAAITYTSGYVTNMTVISTLMGRGDYVFSDKLNHASIVDGCLMSGAKFRRFRHNNMDSLERMIEKAPADATKLVVADAVFSMDGDIIDLPRMVEICREHDAWLMMDEAHSLGVLGETGRGIEEHFGLDDVVDVKMGTLSKTIPSVGGYIAGKQDLIYFLRHASRAYIFSAALPPAQAAAAKEAFDVILDEPWRVDKLRANTEQFINGLQARGLDTLNSETAIVPVMCGSDEDAFAVTEYAQKHDIFVLPVLSPAVPVGESRLRATVLASHEPEDIEKAMDIIAEVAEQAGIL